MRNRSSTPTMMRRLGAVVFLTPALSMAGPVADNDLINAADNHSEWLSYGRTYDNQRFSELSEIKPANVARLRPVFGFSTGGKLAGLEATPLVNDGVMYFSADYSRVFAVNARTGIQLWSFEPEYDDALEAQLCCGPVNRGVALHGNLVFVATLDSRLVALDKTTGQIVWEQTFGDWKASYTSTGAPLIVNGQVIVGHAGAEYGVRGYIKAFDVNTGNLKWQTYTIPGRGEDGNESWPGNTWMTGGASTWLTGAFDPDLNLIYWGTGNPGPWNSDLRKGDNKWSSSLLALDADSGEIKWGYQYTPNDAWDYDGNNTPILVDVDIDGTSTKVAIQANRNGFLYVLNRTNGDFIYAVPTVPGINWTTGLDSETGRPVVNEKKRAMSGGNTVEAIIPGLEGGTNWFPIAYNPDLQYVFLNSNDWAMSLTAWRPEEVIYKSGELYMGVDYQMYRHKPHVGRTMAFDLNTREFVWETANQLPLFSGILATKSGLVFTGDERGYFMALDARSGDVLWKFQTGSGINASPITYELDGTQYVAILSGLGGDPSLYYSGPKGGMLWVFAIDGGQAIESDAMSQTPIEGALPSLNE